MRPLCRKALKWPLANAETSREDVPVNDDLRIPAPNPNDGFGALLWFGALGGVALCLGGYLAWGQLELSRDGHRTVAVVVDLHVKEDGETVRCPILEFSTARGELVRHTSDLCWGASPWPVGAPVRVIYRAEDPYVPTIDSWIRFRYAGILLLAGAFALLFVGWSVRLKRNARPPPAPTRWPHEDDEEGSTQVVE